MIVAAAAGFEYLSACRRGGALHAMPIVAWQFQVAEAGGITWPRPITLGLVPWDHDTAYAVRFPDGRIMDNAETGRIFGSADEWLFAIRAEATGHHMIEGTA